MYTFYFLLGLYYFGCYLLLYKGHYTGDVIYYYNNAFYNVIYIYYYIILYFIIIINY